MTSTLGRMAFAVVFCTLCATVSQAGELTLVTEESPPNNMLVDGKIVGISTDKIAEIMKRANIAYHIEILPWARAYQTALTSTHACVFSTTRTPEREDKFKWVGPLGFSSWVLYALPERKFKFKTLEDARPYTIGTYNSDVIDTYLRERHFKVDAVDADSVNPRKLLLGRIDLWGGGYYTAHGYLVVNGLTDKIVPVFTIKKTELYLACNPGIATDDIDRMNIVLQSMANDGSAGAIDKRYDSWPN